MGNVMYECLCTLSGVGRGCGDIGQVGKQGRVGERGGVVRLSGTSVAGIVVDKPHVNKIRDWERPSFKTFIITCKQVIPKAELVCKDLIFLAQTSCYICSLCGFLLHALANHNNLCIVYYLDLKIRPLPCGPFPSFPSAGHNITVTTELGPKCSTRRQSTN